LITFTTTDTEAAATEVKNRYAVDPQVTDGTIRFHVSGGDKFLPEFVRSFPFPLETVSLQRPSLDDVFITLTGHEIRDSELNERDQLLSHAARWRG
jgi:ABC-2 type transport system ATP-binding protein